jgi:membrane protease subunit HflK
MTRSRTALVSSNVMVGSALALLALIWAGSGLHTLDAGERGIVLRFGEYRAVIPPGLHWRAPWPVETVSVVDTGYVETFEYTDRMLTADENIVAVNLMVQYTRLGRDAAQGPS